MRKIFVGGLTKTTTEDDFIAHFAQYGNVTDKVIMKDKQTGAPKGFGFITYDSSECVEKVFKARPHTLDSKVVDVKRAIPRDMDNGNLKVTKLFVGGFKGMSPDLTVEELQTYLEGRHPKEFGSVDKIDLIKDKDTQALKGFGFIEVSSFDYADRLAITEQSFNIRDKKMGLKKAAEKGQEGGSGRGAARGRGRGRGDFAGRGGGRGGPQGYGGGYAPMMGQGMMGGYGAGYGGYGSGYGGYQGGPPARYAPY